MGIGNWIMLTNTMSKPLRWQRSNYSPLARQIDIFGAAVELMFYLWRDNIFSHNSTAMRQRRAQWLVNKLLNLGPTFIKIGQALSTRIDLLPLEYIEALGKLQDGVPEFSTGEAIALIEAELGKSIHTLYRDFDRFPLAAASLGQVHKARLHTGEEVVVKVQRPGLEKLFNLDFKVLRQLVNFCQYYLPWTKRYNLEMIYNEFFTILYQEIDYVQEGKNADRFRQNFSNYPLVVVPQIYWQYTTTKVLTMEYLPGIKIDDRETIEACGLSVKKINQIGICSYLKQLLQDGFFQADPHPGNMAITQDCRIIFYDFGMMAEVPALAKEEMVKNFFAVMKRDADLVVDTLISMGLIERVGDMKPIRRMITFLLDRFLEKPIDIKAFGEMKIEIYAMFEQQPFRLPPQMTFILKALTTLDGIARKLDPEYNLMVCAQPFIKSITVSSGKGKAIGELARQARDLIKYRLQQPSAGEVLIRRLEEKIDRGEFELRVKSLESDRTLKRINLALKSLIYVCLTGFTLLSGAVLLVGGYKGGAIACLTIAALAFLALVRSLVDLKVREKLDRFLEK